MDRDLGVVRAGLDAQVAATASGVQVVADLGGEGLLLALATQVEQAAPWARRAPGY